MSSNARQLTENGQPIFPVTDVSLVMGLGNVPFMDAVFAWKGDATPVPADIPAGVVVTYNNVNYTGTLAASASTTGRFYLVASANTPGEYDRYLTGAVGGSYAWAQAGTTAIPSPTIADNETTNDPTLAHSAAGGKRLKDELAGLEQEKADKDMVRAYMMSVRAKNALLSVFDKVAFAFPDVSAEMDELENALFNFDEVVGIEATFTQGESVFFDQGVSTLDDLKNDLLVKAVYGDGTKVPINSYTLSGDLSTAGTQTITAYFLGYTDTFNVVVTHYTAQMQFTLADGDVSKFQGVLGRQTADNTILGISSFETSQNRRVFLAESGTTPIEQINGTSTGKYPIPVPRNAKKFTIDINPGSYSNCGYAVTYLENGEYRLIDPYIYHGFFDVPKTRILSAAEVDAYRKGGWYLVAQAATKSGNYGTSSEPTNIIITFE